MMDYLRCAYLNRAGPPTPSDGLRVDDMGYCRDAALSGGRAPVSQETGLAPAPEVYLRQEGTTACEV
jgi:hypothetical protein